MKTYNHLYDNIDSFRQFLEDSGLKDSDTLLIRIHSAIHTREEMEHLASSIRMLLPRAQIVGCSAMQVICNGDLIPAACLISVTVFERAKVTTGQIDCLDASGKWKSGEQLAQEAADKFLLSKSGENGFLLAFFPLPYSKIENFADEFNRQHLPVRMLGGAAYLEDESGSPRPDLAYVLTGDTTSVNSAAMAFFTAEELYIYSDYVCGVEPVGRTCTLHSHGCMIDTVDHIDGAQWYAGLLGPETLDQNPSLASIFPIVKRDEKGIACYVEYAQSGETDGSGHVLRSYGEIRDGSQVSLGYFHPQKIYDQVKQLFQNISNSPAETIFAYDCQSRAALLHNCASWEIKNFYTTTISGALLSGEIVSRNGENLYANYTFVTAALSEHENSRFVLRKRELKNISELQEDNVQMLNYLLMNANKTFNNEVQREQTKMQNAMFYNSALGMNNQLKYLYDQETIQLDKAALFYLDNERMVKLFSGSTETFELLKETYAVIEKTLLGRDMFLYSYRDTSFLFVAGSSVSQETYMGLLRRIWDYLLQIRSKDVALSYIVATSFGTEDTIPRLEAALRYAQNHRFSFADYSDIGDEAAREHEEIHLVHVIRDALTHHRVKPYFQEIHSNHSDGKKMYESLIRIFDENQKIYYPDQFLPIAKEYDLYESLSELMVETVIHMFRDKDIRVTINLNVRDIYDHNMLRMIFENMETAAHPENFVFEIVESEEIMDYAYIKEFASRIHEYGAKVAIDDFGSGFSNLLHVLQIEADYIKIDGEIIRTITDDPHCLEFIRLINGWCMDKNQEVIAEYVENEQIQKIMQEIGVAHSQGYFFSKPHEWADS